MTVFRRQQRIDQQIWKPLRGTNKRCSPFGEESTVISRGSRRNSQTGGCVIQIDDGFRRPSPNVAARALPPFFAVREVKRVIDGSSQCATTSHGTSPGRVIFVTRRYRVVLPSNYHLVFRQACSCWPSLLHHPAIYRRRKLPDLPSIRLVIFGSR